MECIGQFASTVVHDFNNVLTVVVANLNMLRRLLGDDARCKVISDAIEAAKQGADLAAGVLAFARRKELEPQEVSVPKLLDGMRDLLEHFLGSNRNYAFNAPGGLPPILVDVNGLELALVNLATNARDAMPDGGTFLIEVAEERMPPDRTAPALKAGDYIRISASDTGCGMDETTLARATEPLFTTKENGKGTGLGLAMIRDFVERSGGAVRIRSDRGRGTTVELLLPLRLGGGTGEPA